MRYRPPLLEYRTRPTMETRQTVLEEPHGEFGFPTQRSVRLLHGVHLAKAHTHFDGFSRRWSSSGRRKIYIARLEAYTEVMVNTLKEKGVRLICHEDLRLSDTLTLKIARVCHLTPQHAMRESRLT